MKFKKIAAISTAIIIASLNLVGCGSKPSEKNKEEGNALKVGMIADVEE